MPCHRQPMIRGSFSEDKVAAQCTCTCRATHCKKWKACTNVNKWCEPASSNHLCFTGQMRAA